MPNLFKGMSGYQWLMESNRTPIANMLFGELWYEQELCILFADTNLGKSILAIQIADSISKGQPSLGFKLEAPAQKVLYFDFEMSKMQFALRYSLPHPVTKKFTETYSFGPNFIRAELNPDAVPPPHLSFEECILQGIEQSVVKRDAKVLIIDNLTYLKADNETAKDALPLMKQLKALKARYNLSILVLAHTPKRDLSKPIARNDLQGSKMLINFVDSCFAIGESTLNSSVRYLKQIKARNTEILYSDDNVILCQIEKPYNFLGFKHLGYSTEWEHLKQSTDREREQLEDDILQLKIDNPKLSIRQIAQQTGASRMRVQRVLKKNKEVE